MIFSYMHWMDDYNNSESSVGLVKGFPFQVYYSVVLTALRKHCRRKQLGFMLICTALNCDQTLKQHQYDPDSSHSVYTL